MLFSARRACLVISFALVLGLGLVPKSAHAQTGWEYVPELGGYLDWDSGLVWGEQKGISTWDKSVTYMSNLRTSTGFPWRQPTVAECQLAEAHGIYLVPSVTVEGRTIASGRDCWTSDTKNNGSAKSWHYVVGFWNSGILSVNQFGNGSLIDSIPVYRAFTP
jgi:hypothetical protein